MRPRRVHRAGSLAALAAALVAASLLAPWPAHAAEPAPGPDWSQVRAVRVATDLAFPNDIAPAPDGAIYYTEKMAANLTRLDPTTGATEVVWQADAVRARDERGMIGLALDPGFAGNGAFWVFYTKPNADPDGGVNRLVRVQDGEERVVLDGIPGYKRHNGGRIVFAPDGNLFLAVGENELNKPAQDPDSLLGKVLRLTPEGGPVEGNLKGFVYSMGHRNPYGLAYDAATGRLFETENSGWQRDEVNLIEAGKNYGFPVCEGFSKFDSEEPCPSQYAPPLGEFTHDSTVSPVGAAIFHGDLYWASWNKGDIHRLRPGAPGEPWVNEVVYKTSPWQRLIDLEPSADGDALYFSTMSDIWRLEFPGLASPAQGGDGGGAGSDHGDGGAGTGSGDGSGAGTGDGSGDGTGATGARDVPAGPPARPTPGLGLLALLGALAALAALAGPRPRP